jgi:hypothetical protein
LNFKEGKIMLEWKKNLETELAYRVNCINELSDAFIEVVKYQTQINYLDKEDLTVNIHSVIARPDDVLLHIPQTHPCFKKYKTESTGVSAYGTRSYIIHLVTKEKVFCHRTDKDRFRNKIRKELGKDYDITK